jgi:hypothetical protein
LTFETFGRVRQRTPESQKRTILKGVVQRGLVTATKGTVILSERNERGIPAFLKRKYRDSSLPLKMAYPKSFPRSDWSA